MRPPVQIPTPLVAALVLLLGLPACETKKAGGGVPAPSGTAAASAPAGSASAPASAAAPNGSASAAGSAAVPAPAAEFGPTGTELETAAVGPECKSARNEIGTYLQRGELDIAGREGAIAAAYLIQLPNKPAAQVAFGGFDGEAKQLAPKRGIGSSKDHAPRVFSSGPDWTVAWFDQEGLAHARPRWETQPNPDVAHLASIGPDVAADVALGPSPSGALVVSAPYGADKGQLSLFSFAPIEPDAPPVKAIAVTKRAKKPTRPAVAADAAGYFLAWHDEGGAIVATRFDTSGKEGEAISTIAPASEAKRDDLTLVATTKGALAVWLEGGTVLSRALNAASQPTGPAHKIGTGRWLAATSSGDVVVAAWVGKVGEEDDQLLAAKIGEDGTPGAKALVVSTPKTPVKDPPAVALAGPRAAFAWTEMMGVGVATKRANLRVIDAACLP